MPSIDNAFMWAIQTCNHPRVGYSRQYRDASTCYGLDGPFNVTYYDCSSFVWFALKNGGFDVVGANGGQTWPFTTWTMGDVLKKLGFVEVPIEGQWLPGDICLTVKGEHTEMVYSGGIGQGVNMGAHGREGVILPNQVSIGLKNGDATGISYASRWQYLYRWGAGGARPNYQWIVYPEQPYTYLTEAQMTNNAHCFAGYFLTKGWSVAAIAGWLGCMEWESSIHPAAIEEGYPQYAPQEKGMGLVQWTPDDGYGGYPNPLEKTFRALGYTDKPFMQIYYDGNKQCDVIQAEYEQYKHIKDYGISPQWWETNPNIPMQYRIPWDVYNQITEFDAELMVKTWLYCYGRGATDTLHVEQRVASAKKWYEVIKNDSPYLPPQIADSSKHRMPIWMMTRRY